MKYIKQKCNIHGHDLVPVLGFDNFIIDFSCCILGALESEIEKKLTK